MQDTIAKCESGMWRMHLEKLRRLLVPENFSYLFNYEGNKIQEGNLHPHRTPKLLKPSTSFSRSLRQATPPQNHNLISY